MSITSFNRRVFNDITIDGAFLRTNINTQGHTSEQLVYFNFTGDIASFPSSNTYVKVVGSLIAPFNIFGIDATGYKGVNGQDLTIYNGTNQQIFIINDSVSAIPGNRIFTPSSGGVFNVLPTTSARFIYDRAAEHWLMICCEFQVNNE
jgi:hypothetical protein